MIYIKVKNQDEIRRISVNNSSNDSCWEVILEEITNRFGENLPQPFCVKYLDDEEELITIDSNEELQEALRILPAPVLKLSVFPLQVASPQLAKAQSGLEPFQRCFQRIDSPTMSDIDFTIDYDAPSDVLKQQVNDLKMLVSFRIKQLRQKTFDLYNESTMLQMQAMDTKKRGKKIKRQYHDMQKKTRKIIQQAKTVLKERSKAKRRNVPTLSPQSFLSNELNGVLKEIAEEIEGSNQKKIQQYVKFEEPREDDSTSTTSSEEYDEEDYEEEEQYEAEVPECIEVEDYEEEEPDEEEDEELEECEDEEIEDDIMTSDDITGEHQRLRDSCYSENTNLTESQMTAATEQEEDEEEELEQVDDEDHYDCRDDESELDDRLLFDSQMTENSTNLNESQASANNIPLQLSEDNIVDEHEDEDEDDLSSEEEEEDESSSDEDEEEDNINDDEEEEIKREMAEAEESIEAMIQASEKKFEESTSNNNVEKVLEPAVRPTPSIKKPFLISFFTSIFENKPKEQSNNNNNISEKKLGQEAPVAIPAIIPVEEPVAMPIPIIPPQMNLLDESIPSIMSDSPIMSEESSEDININNNNFEPVVEDLPPVYEPEMVIPGTDSLFASSISLLNEMGWTDNHKNKELLGKHNGDISEAIRELLEC